MTRLLIASSPIMSRYCRRQSEIRAQSSSHIEASDSASPKFVLIATVGLFRQSRISESEARGGGGASLHFPHIIGQALISLLAPSLRNCQPKIQVIARPFVPPKESRSQLLEAGHAGQGTQPLLVHLLSGATEPVEGTASIFVEHGQLVCCSGEGLTLRTFDSADITFATFDPSFISFNVWI